MTKIAQSLFELSDSIAYLNLNCSSSNYPTEFQTYEEGWAELPKSLDHLRKKLGEARYAQLVEMAVQAKAHYDQGYKAGYMASSATKPSDAGLEDIKLGSWLMQDMGQVVRGNQPFAYPEELYRWPR